jgi:cyclohexanone monooxygenase
MAAPYLAECTPGYYNNEGQMSERTAKNASFGRGPVVFIKMLEDWRASGTFPGLEIS